MSHIVICKCCGEKFDRDTEPFAQVGNRRYAHAKCVPTGTAIIDPHNTVLCKYCGKEMDIKTAVNLSAIINICSCNTVKAGTFRCHTPCKF